MIGSLIWRSNSPIWDAIEKSGQGIPKFQDTALPGHLLYNDISNEHCEYEVNCHLKWIIFGILMKILNICVNLIK